MAWMFLWSPALTLHLSFTKFDLILTSDCWVHEKYLQNPGAWGQQCQIDYPKVFNHQLHFMFCLHSKSFHWFWLVSAELLAHVIIQPLSRYDDITTCSMYDFISGTRRDIKKTVGSNLPRLWCSLAPKNNNCWKHQLTNGCKSVAGWYK